MNKKGVELSKNREPNDESWDSGSWQTLSCLSMHVSSLCHSQFEQICLDMVV